MSDYSSSSCNSHCKPCLEKPKLCSNELWKSVDQNLIGNRSNPSVGLNKYTIKDILEKWKVPLSSFPDGTSNTYANGSADEKSVYITTQNNYDSQGSQINAEGSVICVDRKTGEINWKRTIKSYSGITGDNTRAAPAIWKNFLFFGSNILEPQTYYNPIGPVLIRFAGFPATATGKRIRMYCVNKHTGDLVWETPIGKVATNLNDEDNWLTITQSPIVFKSIIDNTNYIRDLVAVGTSSGQSFQPWLRTLGGQVLGERFDFQMTDRGRQVILDANDGTVIKEIFLCPEVLKAGDTLPASSIIPGKNFFYIRHAVTQADLTPGGDLNPITAPYAIISRLTYILETGNNVPSPCDGINVVDANNNPVVLVGGTLIGAELNQVVVKLEAALIVNTTTMQVNGIDYDVTDPTVGLLSGTKVARIGKVLGVGDTLSARDAYECNYFGASSWGNGPSVEFEEKYVKGCHKKIATKLIFPSGQTHAIPYDESEFMNNPLTNYLTCSTIIGVAQQNYISNQTQVNYDFMQLAYEKLNQTILYRLALDLSLRGKQNRHASIICASLKSYNFGEIEWDLKRDNYDYWQLGYTLGPRSAFLPGWSNIQDFYERPIGPDGDFGQGAYFYKQCGYNRMVSINKGGFLEVHDLNVSPPNRIFRKLVGNPEPIGVSNFGSTLSNEFFMTIGTQAFSQTSVNKGAPSPVNYPAQLRWYLTPDKYFDINQSFVFNFNVKTLQFEWHELVVPDQVQPFEPTISPIASSQELVYLPAVDGKLHIRDIKSGNEVKVLELDGVGGNSSPIILDNEIYVALGRDALGGTYASQYGPGKYLRKFALSHQPKPHCPPKQYHCPPKQSHCQCKPHCPPKQYHCPPKQYPPHRPYYFKPKHNIPYCPPKTYCQPNDKYGPSHHGNNFQSWYDSYLSKNCYGGNHGGYY